MPIDSETGYPQCKNPNCPKYGHSHPNCRCSLAKGGEVVEFNDHFCSMARLHDSSCPYYMQGGLTHAYNPPPIYASGGPVNEPLLDGGLPSPSPEPPGLTMGHYAHNSGLSEVFSRAGHSKSPDPLHHLQEYTDMAARGKKHLTSYIDNIFLKSEPLVTKESHNLKKFLKKSDENPDSLLELGGALGSSMPEHAAQIGAQAAITISYFKGLKPHTQQLGPLDTPSKPDPLAERQYDRQIHIAENPAVVVERLKNGTLLPQDLTTVSTLYPHLYDRMKQQVENQLIEHKAKGGEISYKQRQSLSLFLGHPLDYSQTPAARQTIMASAGPQQAQRIPQPKKGDKNQARKATSAELKQLNKVDELSETSLQAHLINKNNK